jgi:CBS-domain-containing membrane protein
MSLLRQGKAQMLTLYLGESDQWRGTPLYVALLQVFREAGCAGATVTRAMAGYGAGGRLHEGKGWHWSSDAPLIVQVVDQPERLRRLLPQIQNMMQGGLLTLQEVDVLKYTHARRSGISPKLPVSQVMETAVVTVSLETPVTMIVELLLQAPFRVLPVVDADNRLCGIVSTGDLIVAGLLPMRRGIVRRAQELDTSTAQAMATLRGVQSDIAARTAQEIMNRQVRTLRPDQTLREAAQLFIDLQVRNLPVVEEDNTLRGILTRADVLQAIRTSPLMSPDASSATQPLSHTQPLPGLAPQQQPITIYLNSEVATVAEDTPFAETVDLLLTSPLKRVIVVDTEQHVRGIISDVDVLARLQQAGRSSFLTMLAHLAHSKLPHLPTGPLQAVHDQARITAEVMNPHVITIANTATVQEAVDLMLSTHRKLLPVVDAQGRLLGTVGRMDVLRVFLESEQEG